MFTIIDTETTGLNKKSDLLLEVAVVITDDDLNEVAALEVVIDPGSPHWKSRMDDVAKAMHTKNGLIAAIDQRRGLGLGEAQARIYSFLRIYMPERVPMTGSTIDFDRAFLLRDMPKVEGLFHYRSINISSLKELVVRWAPELAYPSIPADEKPHRALDDALESIEELKHYRKVLFAAHPQLA